MVNFPTWIPDCDSHGPALFIFISYDWQFTLIEQSETHEQLKERETFWQHRLKTFYPYGLNEKKEYLY